MPAKTVKTIAASGDAAVTTTSNGAHTASSPDCVSIEFTHTEKVGVSVNSECAVTKITAKSQGESRGVKVGWVVLKVTFKMPKDAKGRRGAGTSGAAADSTVGVSLPCSTSNDVSQALKRGRASKAPFVVHFRCPEKSGDAGKLGDVAAAAGEAKEGAAGTAAAAADGAAAAEGGGTGTAARAPATMSAEEAAAAAAAAAAVLVAVAAAAAADLEMTELEARLLALLVTLPEGGSESPERLSLQEEVALKKSEVEKLHEEVRAAEAASAAADPAVAAAAAAAAAVAAAEAEARRQKAEAEEAARMKVLGNGQAVIRYNMYDEPFDITDGTITAEAIDELYALSFAMPGCSIHLSATSPEACHTEDKGYQDPIMLREDPPGTMHGLRTDTQYWAYAIQDTTQLRYDQAKAKEMFKPEEDEHGNKLPLSDSYQGEGIPESCSCIEGNPCVDEYGCRDWHHRRDVAMKNGWKGF
jgi:hypothetical protein